MESIEREEGTWCWLGGGDWLEKVVEWKRKERRKVQLNKSRFSWR